MKKIESAIIMFAILIIGIAYVACDSDETVNPSDPGDSGNMSAYQKIVNETVKDAHKQDKVILLVAFGSTYQQAFDTFDATVSAYKEEFPDYDVFLSFSSAICINRAAQAENTEARNFYAPIYWLNAFAQEGVQYKEIIVQSLQVIPGEEYTRVINAMKDFQNNATADLDDEYLASVRVFLGKPLMNSKDEDVPRVAHELNEEYKEIVDRDSCYMLFMGHGNPDSYDTYKANIRYTELEEALQEINSRYFVGTVDMADNFKVQVYERMEEAGFTSGTVYCHPLMSIAGDHAHNDMAGDDDAYNGNFEVNDEGEVEDTSWKKYFYHKGFTCNDDTQILIGLLDLPQIRQIWIDHTYEAEEFDYYHSMYPEEE